MNTCSNICYSFAYLKYLMNKIKVPGSIWAVRDNTIPRDERFCPTVCYGCDLRHFTSFGPPSVSFFLGHFSLLLGKFSMFSLTFPLFEDASIGSNVTLEFNFYLLCVPVNIILIDACI